MAEEEFPGAAVHAVPILTVEDVAETLAYWQTALGFPDKWTWGEPPDYGGVTWNGAQIHFSQNTGFAPISKGIAIFIKVKNLQALYLFHQHKNVEIIEPLENKPWGMAGYTVREINGYYIVFAGATVRDKETKSEPLPSTITIISRSPSIAEYQSLTSSVGWSIYSDDTIVEKLLAAPVFAVVAEDIMTKQVVGCALLLGDHASFYYIKDVVVHPSYQSKHVGSLMMEEISAWLDNNGANKALVALITSESLSPFYQQFGFGPTFSMLKYIQRRNKTTDEVDQTNSHER